MNRHDNRHDNRSRASRRDVLKTIGLAGVMGAGAAPLLASPRRGWAQDSGLNIVWLMSDEHNPFVAGYAGDPHALTPTMDALAGRGAPFSAAYTPDPICQQSRAAFCAGRMYSNIKPGNYEAIGPYFTRMGFQTAWFGKKHWEDLQNRFDIEGESCSKVIKQRFKDAGLDFPEGSRLVQDASLAHWGTDLNEDDVAVEQALAFLDGVGTRRFFMGVSCVKPHFPFVIQPPYYAPFSGHQIPRPVVSQAMLDNLSAAMKQDRLTFEIDRLSDEQSDFARAVYYGMVSYVDERLGLVLAKLDALGLRERTIVLYTSDHGEMLGAHGIWYKNAFYEGSARVPLVISVPGLGQRPTVPVPVNTIDLFPTLCDACGLPPPPTLEGRSLLPLMTGADDGKDRVAFSENKRRGIAARMIRTRDYKYCWYDDGHEELYDMVNDRDIEGSNLAPLPAYAQVKAKLRKQALKGWNPDGLKDGGS